MLGEKGLCADCPAGALPALPDTLCLPGDEHGGRAFRRVHFSNTLCLPGDGCFGGYIFLTHLAYPGMTAATDVL